MDNLFVYGTLIFPEVVALLTGKTFAMMPAVLPGYRRLMVSGGDYPAIVKNRNSVTDGYVLESVDADSMRKLSFYEGDEYEKIVVNVKVGGTKYSKAVTFVWKGELKFLDKGEWDPEKFRYNSLDVYLRKIIFELTDKWTDPGRSEL